MKPARRRLQSSIPKRSIIVGGKQTSISLEGFWEALRQIVKERQTTLHDLFTTINAERRDANLASAVRVYILAHFQNQTVASNGQRRVNETSESPPEVAGPD
jgi:predicted DNA-binding ribbon-helix-helix protein